MLLAISKSREESQEDFSSQQQGKKTFKNHTSAIAGRSSDRHGLSPPRK